MRRLALSLIVLLVCAPFRGAGAQVRDEGSAQEVAGDATTVAIEPAASETVVDRADPTGGSHRGSTTTGEFGGLATPHDDASTAPMRTPSASVRRAGPPGAPALLSVRGGEPTHTRTTLAGMPLDGAFQGGFDLAMLPAPLLGRFRLYRSNVPLHLGPPGLAGVLAIELPDAIDGGVALGAGSWGRHRLAAVAANRSARQATVVGAVLQGAANRYPYFDDNGTPFDTSDDRTRRRQNAGMEHASVLALHQWNATRREAQLFALASVSERGVAGLGRVETQHASLSEYRVDTALRVTSNSRRQLRMQTLGWLSVGSRVFRDPRDEFSARVSSFVRDHALRAGLSAQPLVVHTQRLRTRWLLELEAERWATDRSQVATTGDATRVRLGTGVELSAELRPRVTAGATLRLDLMRDQAEADTDWRSLPAPQVGVAMRLLDGWRTSLDLAFTGAFVSRAPSFSERFADLGQSVGNAELRAENRFGGDAGLTLETRTGPLQLRAHTAAYARRARQLIVFIDTGSGARRPENVDTANLTGVEAEVEALTWGSISMSARYAWQSARDADTKVQLPYRAIHQGGATIGVSESGVDASFSIDAASWRGVDRAGLSRIPRRVTFDSQLAFAPPAGRGWGVGVSLLNLTDRRVERVPLRDGGEVRSAPAAVADYVGSPLPGRSVFATVTYDAP